MAKTTNNTAASDLVANLGSLKKADLIALLLKATEAPVGQDVEETKVRCTGIAASTGEQCSRNATTEAADGEPRCKSHQDWDNEEAKAKFAKAEEFVADLREKAEKKAKTKATKVDNKALAALMREAGVNPAGNPWKVAKDAIAEGATMEEAAQAARKSAGKDELLKPKAAKKGKGKAKKAAPKADAGDDLLAKVAALLAEAGVEV